MEVLILAAGYARRLAPLTDRLAKPLLPVGPKLLIDHIMEHVRELRDVRRIHVVTNSRFHADFEQWAAGRPERDLITVHNDQTTDNGNRLGAIGDIEFVIRTAGVRDDLWVVAGDNLFDFDLGGLQDFFERKGTTCAVLRHFGDAELIKEYSNAELDAAERVVRFIEKPKEPFSDLIGICCYLFAARDLSRFAEYPDLRNHAREAPGFFMEWLHEETEVHGFLSDGLWYDIGNKQQLLEADYVMRMRSGMWKP